MADYSRLRIGVEEAKEFEFTGTPGFMVNGAPVHGAYPYEFFKKVIDKILAGEKTQPTQDSTKPTDEKKPAS